MFPNFKHQPLRYSKHQNVRFINILRGIPGNTGHAGKSLEMKRSIRYRGVGKNPEGMLSNVKYQHSSFYYRDTQMLLRGDGASAHADTADAG